MPSEPWTERLDDGWRLSDDPSRFDADRAFGWISTKSYWAAGIPRETFERSLRGSMVVGAYDTDGVQAAMARVVTDRATFALVCDVFVDDARRGAGLGKKLMAYLMDHPDLQGLRRRALVTADAHGLYAQYGFAPLAQPERWMEIRDVDVYRR